MYFPTFRSRKLLPSCIAIPIDLYRDAPVAACIRHRPTNATPFFGVVWRPFRTVVDTVLVDDEPTLRTVPLSTVSSELDLRALGALVGRSESFVSLNTYLSGCSVCFVATLDESVDMVDRRKSPGSGLLEVGGKTQHSCRHRT